MGDSPSRSRCSRRDVIRRCTIARCRFTESIRPIPMTQMGEKLWLEFGCAAEARGLPIDFIEMIDEDQDLHLCRMRTPIRFPVMRPPSLGYWRFMRCMTNRSPRSDGFWPWLPKSTREPPPVRTPHHGLIGVQAARYWIVSLSRVQASVLGPSTALAPDADLEGRLDRDHRAQKKDPRASWRNSGMPDEQQVHELPAECRLPGIRAIRSNRTPSGCERQVHDPPQPAIPAPAAGRSAGRIRPAPPHPPRPRVHRLQAGARHPHQGDRLHGGVRLHAEPVFRLRLRVYLLLRGLLFAGLGHHDRGGEARQLGAMGGGQGERDRPSRAEAEASGRHVDLHEQRDGSVSARRAQAEAHAWAAEDSRESAPAKAGGADEESRRGSRRGSVSRDRPGRRKGSRST